MKHKENIPSEIQARKHSNKRRKGPATGKAVRFYSGLTPAGVWSFRALPAPALCGPVAELGRTAAVTILRKHLQSIQWEFYGQ